MTVQLHVLLCARTESETRRRKKYGESRQFSFSEKNSSYSFTCPNYFRMTISAIKLDHNARSLHAASSPLPISISFGSLVSHLGRAQGRKTRRRCPPLSLLPRPIELTCRDDCAASFGATFEIKRREEEGRPPPLPFFCRNGTREGGGPWLQGK